MIDTPTGDTREVPAEQSGAPRRAATRTWARVRAMWHSAGAHDPRLPTAGFDFDSTLRPYRGRGPSEELTLTFLAGLAASFNLVIISNRLSSRPPGPKARGPAPEGHRSCPKETAVAPLREYAAALDARGARATVYAPTAHDRDRKPHTGAWEHYAALSEGEAPPRATAQFAFFCGDAAGRPGDHSAADYLFALNVGLAFTTPEALFAGAGDPWLPRGWAAAPLPLRAQGDQSPAGRECPLADLARDVARGAVCVVMVGSPASGKTHAAARLVMSVGPRKGSADVTAGVAAVRGSAACALVSRDLQGGAAQKAFAAALSRGDSVVVDNTNPTAEDRAAFAGPARDAGYRVVFCHVSTPKELCFHLNGARCQLDPTGRTPELPPVALHTYWKRHVAPTAEEVAAFGGSLIVVPFSLSPGAPREITDYRYC